MPCGIQHRRWLGRLLAGFLCAAGWFGTSRAQSRLSPASPDSSGPNLPLTRIADVKAWADWAEQSLAIELEGVVTCVGPGGNFFLQDGPMGIHVGPSERGRKLKPGYRVKVLGATRRGAYAPSIEPREVIPLGRSSLPAPVRTAYSVVASGALDGSFVEVEGVVCDAGADAAGVPFVTLATDGRRLRATVYGEARIDPHELIDAEVRLRGAASGSFNNRRQLVEPALRVPAASFIEIVRPPSDAFAAPLMPLTRLLGFSIEAPGAHRVRIQGTVTRRVSERELFVRADGLGLRLETRAPVDVAPGNVIDAVGFPAIARGAAVLESAVTRVVASGPAPAPVRAEAAALFAGAHTADLVRVRARLVDSVATADSASLILENSGQLLRATVLHPSAPAAMPANGSVLDVTAISVVNEPEGGSANPASLLLLVSEPADISLLRRPDWWTAERLWRALAGLAVLLVAGLAWVWSLRRQVRRKRAVIEEQARHAAVLEERSRIARDLHDTIEQGLTGLSLQLKVVEMDCKESPESVGRGLEAARQMLRQSRALAHNAIRELRTDDVARANEPLAAALERIAEGWKQSGIGGVRVVVDGTAFPLPPSTERQLASITAEAITNAIKHGHATAIDIRLRYADDGVRLEVTDDGGGFDPGKASTGGAPGFGLIGMRERAMAVGGKFEVRSAPGRGATVAIEIPRNACRGPVTSATAQSRSAAAGRAR